MNPKSLLGGLTVAGLLASSVATAQLPANTDDVITKSSGESSFVVSKCNKNDEEEHKKKKKKKKADGSCSEGGCSEGSCG